MNILDFAINYPDEEPCRKKLKALRDQMRVTCRHCDCKEHYWLENKEACEYKRCHARQTLRFGYCYAAFQPALSLSVCGHTPAHAHIVILFHD